MELEGDSEEDGDDNQDDRRRRTTGQRDRGRRQRRLRMSWHGKGDSDNDMMKAAAGRTTIDGDDGPTAARRRAMKRTVRARLLN